jgi:hypothetical protein
MAVRGFRWKRAARDYARAFVLSNWPWERVEKTGVAEEVEGIGRGDEALAGVENL